MVVFSPGKPLKDAVFRLHAVNTSNMRWRSEGMSARAERGTSGEAMAGILLVCSCYIPRESRIIKALN